jgi:hypothetical protein
MYFIFQCAELLQIFQINDVSFNFRRVSQIVGVFPSVSTNVH